MPNIWNSLPKPCTVLAPMDDVTDVTFREVVCEIARPDLFFTEFTNVEALCSAGRSSQIRRLEYSKRQHPIIAQIWGLEPNHYAKTTHLVRELGFDGVDINMGCPIRVVVQNGACAAFIKDHVRAKEVIHATQEAAGDMPVSVKTRLGFAKPEIESWIGFLLNQKLAAITIHGRTVKELSTVPCHWDEIGKVVELRNAMHSDTRIIGNGDVKNYQAALQISKVHGVDGVMIGRGIFEDLLAFSTGDHAPLTTRQKLDLLIHHAKLFETTWGDSKPFDVIKKFFKVYASGFPGAQELRLHLMDAKNAQDISTILQQHPTEG